MTITNGYGTLAGFKDRYLRQRSYTSVYLACDSATNTITDTRNGLAKLFSDAAYLEVSGFTTAGNNGIFTVSTVSASAVVVTEALTTEALGDSVTISDVSDPTNDTLIESLIQSVSRQIDDYCDRVFYTSSSASERIYTAATPHSVYIDDATKVYTVAIDVDGDGTFESTLSASDYYEYPDNGALPITWLETSYLGQYAFPTHRRGVSVTADWGYSTTVPDQIKEACYIQAWRLFERRNAPFGISGGGQFGQAITLPDLDPDVKMLIGSFVRVITGVP